MPCPAPTQSVAGCSLRVCNEGESSEAMDDAKEEAASEFDELVNEFEKQDVGVYVQASTIGSLEALLAFLKGVNIPVCQAGIGVVHKRDVKKAAIMRDKGKPEYACILAFDVKVSYM